MKNKKYNICIVGMGYVGLPLALEFGKFANTLGYDIDANRVNNLNINKDINKEHKTTEFKKSKYLNFSSNIEDLKRYNVFIICLPTPINKKNVPDLKNINNFNKKLGCIIKQKDTVIYESTVYPGVTEDIFQPILEKYSNLRAHTNNHKSSKYFYLGYSPERINPGDKVHSLTNIKKIISAKSIKSQKIVYSIYKIIKNLNLYLSENIKIAESAKVIENIQRDINIALVNELAIIFNKMKIDTEAVLRAAETKWNFASYRPGLVGGHCIGVDPYYLSYIAKKNRINPKIILTGRRINNNMIKVIEKRILGLMRNENINLLNSKVLFMGYSYKENCSDIRNTKIYDLYISLKKKVNKIDIYDPLIDINKVSYFVKDSFIKLLPKKKKYDAVVFLVSHDIFKNLTLKDINLFLKKKNIIFDVKYMLNKKITSNKL